MPFQQQTQQTNQVLENKPYPPASKVVSLLKLWGFIFASVVILSLFAAKSGFLNALVWVYVGGGDFIFILIVLISWFFTFSLPGIFLYSFLNRSWRLPVIFLGLASISILFILVPNLVTNPGMILNLPFIILSSGLASSLQLGEAQLIMFLIFLMSAIPIFKDPLSKLSKLVKPILIFEGLVFSLFIIISVIFPTLLIQAERGVSDIFVGSPTQPPIGMIFYETFVELPSGGPDFDSPLLYSISSTGERRAYQLPKGCHVVDIADDKDTATCVVRKQGSNNDTWYLLSLQNDTHKQLAIGRTLVVTDRDYLLITLAPNGKTIFFTDGHYLNKAYVPKIGKFDLETQEEVIIFDPGSNKYSRGNLTASKDGSTIAFIQYERNFAKSQNLLAIDESGEVIADIPITFICGNGLQLSHDNSKVFCWRSGDFFKGEDATFYLIDLRSKQINSLVVSSARSGNSYISGETGGMEKGKAVLYDGKDTIYFHFENGVKKINFKDQKLESVFNQHIDALFLNGLFGANRTIEGSSYVTYIYDFSNNKKSKLLNKNEFIVDWIE